VRYAETDQMGVVYHANHFIWFEIGRVDLMRQLGFSYRDLERDHGCFIPVVDARCRYKAPARYDDEIIVRTHLRNVRESVIHFGYELVRADNNELLRKRDHAYDPRFKNEARAVAENLPKGVPPRHREVGS